MDADVRYSLAGNNGAESSLHTKKTKTTTSSAMMMTRKESFISLKHLDDFYLIYLFIFLKDNVPLKMFKGAAALSPIQTKPLCWTISVRSTKNYLYYHNGT